MLLTFITIPALARPSSLLAEAKEATVSLNTNLLFYSKAFVLLLIAFMAIMAYRNWRLEEE